MSTAAKVADQSFFERLPMWGKVLFVLCVPVSLPYFTWRMWKIEEFPIVAKVLITVSVAMLMILGATVTVAQTAYVGPPTAPAVSSSPAVSTQPTATTAPPAPVPSEPAESASAPVPQAAPAIKATEALVIRIVDGDTVEVRMDDGVVEKVRFIGIDTPEDTTEHEPYGAEASAYTAAALDGKTVFLETDAGLRDKYGRLLAYVWLARPSSASDDQIRKHLFNARLLTGGYAQLMTIPPNVKYVDYFKQYAAEARDQNIGLWALESPAPTPPSPAAGVPAPSTAPTTAYIGNRNTMKFHYADCASVDQMNPANKVPIATREAAVSQGYVPCGNCRP